MFDKDPEVYVNGNVELYVYRWDDHVRYWIKGGVGVIEFSKDDFEALLELLVEFHRETKE